MTLETPRQVEIWQPTVDSAAAITKSISRCWCIHDPEQETKLTSPALGTIGHILEEIRTFGQDKCSPYFDA